MALKNDTPPVSIHDVIDNASPERLRNILHALCRSDYNNVKKVLKFHNDMTALEKKQSSSSSSSSNKRKAAGVVAVCMVCLDSFDEAENTETSCVTHPGPWEADTEHSGWDDMWEGDFGGRDYNHEDFFEDMPQAFVMECCGKRGDTKGCRVGRHISRPKDFVNGPESEDEDYDDEESEEEEDEEDEDED